MAGALVRVQFRVSALLRLYPGVGGTGLRMDLLLLRHTLGGDFGAVCMTSSVIVIK